MKRATALYQVFLAIVLWTLSIGFFERPLFAQASQATTAAEPRSTYAFFKSREIKQPLTPRDLTDGELNLGFVVCAYSVEKLFGPQGRRVMALLEHAKRVGDLQSLLAVYPRNLWEKDLEDFEERTLTGIIEEQDPIVAEYRFLEQFVTSMIDKLNEFQKTNSSLPPVVDKAECGGPSGVAVLINVITIPAATRVQFIGSYYFELCKAQGYDPLDTSKCDRWTDIGGDINKSIFAGHVKFLVTWPNAERTGPYDMDVDAIPFEQGERKFTIHR